MSAASHYLERLIRHAAGSPGVEAAYVGGGLSGNSPDPFSELDLYLVAPGGLDPLVWAAALGETAFAGRMAQGCRLVTADGLAINIAVASASEGILMEGLKPVFNRGVGAPTAPGPQPVGDLAQEAARFWNNLYKAGAAIGRGQPLTAHGELEQCREQLINLYRLALAPGRHGDGWAGADTLPGGGRVMEGLQEWLVSPLELKAQWRCANRLASTYESLMLPLTEQLGLAYPYAMRSLAFQRLGEVKPGRKPAEGEAALPPREPEPEPEPPRTAGPARFKVKRRGE